jgi:Ca-activated chloride channel family protein
MEAFRFMTYQEFPNERKKQESVGYAAVQKLSGLTLEDVNKQTTREFVSGIERSVIHYGASVDTFAEEMFNNGPSYLSAAVMDESLVAEANSHTKYTHLAYPVVAIYPQDGTFIADHPFAIPQASWVTPEKAHAAQILRSFLLDAPQQKKAQQYYLRPGSFALSDGSNTLLNRDHGVDLTQPAVP